MIYKTSNNNNSSRLITNYNNSKINSKIKI